MSTGTRKTHTTWRNYQPNSRILPDTGKNRARVTDECTKRISSVARHRLLITFNNTHQNKHYSEHSADPGPCRRHRRLSKLSSLQMPRITAANDIPTMAGSDVACVVKADCSDLAW